MKSPGHDRAASGMPIRAAVLRGSSERYNLEDVELAAPGRHQLLVRIVAAGHCHTDLSIRSADRSALLPIIAGHEGAGVVEAIGEDVASVKVGDHVILSFASCGECEACRKSQPYFCSAFVALNLSGRAADGSTTVRDRAGHEIAAHWFGQSSFATHAITHERNCVVVDRSLPLNILAPLGCGVQTGAGTVFNLFKAQPGEAIAIFGAGSVGLSALMAAKAAGLERIVAVDLHPARLALAQELGATLVIDGRAPAMADEIRGHVPGGVDHCFDTTGHPEVIKNALSILKLGGICASVGPAAMNLDLPQYLLNGRMLTRVIEGNSDPQTFIPKLIELWSSGQFPLEKIITEFRLSELNEAEAASVAGQVIKPVLIADDE